MAIPRDRRVPAPHAFTALMRESRYIMSDTIRPPFKDILQAIPGFFGIRLEEEPAHTVVETIDDVEIRRYQPALLAQVTVRGEHDTAMNDAFTTLAAYIFGKNSEDAKLHMTTPVLQERAGAGTPNSMPLLKHPSGEGWTMSFFLSNNMLPEEAPQPDDPSIELIMAPETLIGALRYTGNDSDERRDDAKTRLLETVERDGRWRVITDVAWALYDQPFSIPFLKRNEAHVALEPVSA